MSAEELLDRFAFFRKEMTKRDYLGVLCIGQLQLIALELFSVIPNSFSHDPNFVNHRM